MGKKSHQLLPLLDYLRIHRVIRSVLDSCGANTAHACWYFSLAGAAILRQHYKKDAHPLAGAMCLMTATDDSKVMCFAKIEDGEARSSADAFHALVVCDDYLIDFMSPIFPETAQSSQHVFIPAAKSFQKPVSSMSPSPSDLTEAGDFFFDPNQELTDSLRRMVMGNRFLTDVIQGCCDWYKRPPKLIPPGIQVSDEKGGVSMVRLKDALVTGAW
ncbi:DUF2026 family protein [Pseudomonas sp. BGr12]|uniref:DUF2026 family protein n=1 Tax=Pseudomonas sp. BGr12 TaxID=2936269 RepID=UPI00255A01B0|nr:DUF2026 family protein [Pseudomonas sp. BJa5]MDL2427650.1 DUF2026 domain-containing protein [Pseudomonas sp. BJa5]